MTIYLLHLEQPLGDPTRPHMSAQHYLGYTDDKNPLERVDQHLRGQGAALTRAAHARGIRMILVGLWPGDKTEERRRKNAGNHQRRCVACNPRLSDHLEAFLLGSLQGR